MFKFRFSMVLVVALALLLTASPTLTQSFLLEEGMRTVSYEDPVLGIQIAYAPELRRVQDEYLFPAYGFTLLDQDHRLALRVGWVHQSTPDDLEELVKQTIAGNSNLDIQKVMTTVAGYPGVAIYPLPGIEPVTCIYVVANKRVYEIFYGRAPLDKRGLALLDALTFTSAKSSLSDAGLLQPDGMDVTALPGPLSHSEFSNDSLDEPHVITPTAAANCVDWPTNKFMRVPFNSNVNGTGVAYAGPSYYGEGMHANCNNSGRSNDYQALDFAMRGGDFVLAPVSGTVVYFGWTYGGFASYGRVVIIDTGSGYQYLAAHLRNFGAVFYPGQQISSGTVIGYAGGSGNGADGTWGNHLHHVFYTNATFSSTGKAMYGGQGVEPHHVRYYRDGVQYYEDITNRMAMSW